MQIPLRVVSPPLVTLVERGVEVQEVGEEPACRHLACQLVEVVVGVAGQIVHATFLLPYLYWEDGSLTVAHSLISRIKQFPHDAAPLSRRVGTIVYGGEHHLVSTA